MKPVVSVERVGKQYALGQRERYESLRENISRRLRSVFSKADRPREEPFWAIRDVSFDVARGQVVGIVGRNGAGKSTLLKILSRIAAPSEGRIVLRGRV